MKTTMIRNVLRDLNNLQKTNGRFISTVLSFANAKDNAYYKVIEYDGNPELKKALYNIITDNSVWPTSSWINEAFRNGNEGGVEVLNKVRERKGTEGVKEFFALPVNRAKLEDMFKSFECEDGLGYYLLLNSSDEVMGGCSLVDIKSDTPEGKKQVDIAMHFLGKYQKCGIGSELSKRLVTHAFECRNDIGAVVGTSLPTQEGTLKACIRAGFSINMENPEKHVKGGGILKYSMNRDQFQNYYRPSRNVIKKSNGSYKDMIRREKYEPAMQLQ